MLEAEGNGPRIAKHIYGKHWSLLAVVYKLNVMSRNDTKRKVHFRTRDDRAKANVQLIG